MAPSAIDPPNPPMEKGKSDLKGPWSPLPPVQTFDGATVTKDELVEALKVAGGAVIKGMLNKDELNKIEKDVRPWLDKDTPWNGRIMITSQKGGRTIC